MNTETVKVDGIEYVLGKFSWGSELDINSECIKVDVKIDAKKMSMVPSPDVNVFRIEFLTVLKALKSWTFRGYDASGNLKTEGEVLPIDEKNAREIPTTHGAKLTVIATKLNKMEGIDLKNLLGQQPKV